MRHFRLVLAGWSLAFVTRPGGVRAEDAIQVRLNYRAPAECLDAAGFAAQVHARTALARITDMETAATTLFVQIKSVAGGSAGTMRLRTENGATAAREVKAATCAQVASALALMAALAIDPEASAEPAPPESAPESTPPTPPDPPHRTRSPPAVPGPRPVRTRFKAGVSLEELGGLSPDPVLHVRPFFEVLREGPSSNGLAFRLSLGRPEAKLRNSEGGGDFTLWAGRFEGCPVHYRAWTKVWVSACLALETGVLRGQGTEVSPSAAVSRAWVAGGATGRFEIRLLGSLTLEVSGAVLLPFVRDRFYLGTDATLHRAPAFTGAGTIGLGALFP